MMKMRLELKLVLPRQRKWFSSSLKPCASKAALKVIKAMILETCQKRGIKMKEMAEIWDSEDQLH